jgi:formylglycine-generating enzyme required for sulfatase activity
MKFSGIVHLIFLTTALTTWADDRPASHFPSPAAATRVDTTAWMAQRRTDFARWQVSHPNTEAQWGDQKARNALPLAEGNLDGVLRHREQPDPALAEPAKLLRDTNAPLELWDSAASPQLVVIPPGEYTMGSPMSEADRKGDEGPQHRVRVNYPLAVGKFDVTVGEYAFFVEQSSYKACGDNWRLSPYMHHSQAMDHPVVAMSWYDAQAYSRWISSKTGHRYRLLTEAEWEYAARAGSSTAYYWGDAFSQRYASNGGGATSPVGTFPPNHFGLYDMAGNVYTWVEDCYKNSYEGAPADGSARTNCSNDRRVLRGGSWGNLPQALRSGNRYKFDPSWHDDGNIGFRLVRTD